MLGQDTSKQTLRILALGVIGLAFAACQQKRPAEAELQATQVASDVYQAYELGDCGTVERLTDEDQLQTWGRTELRYSLVLARAFCLERDGDQASAVEIYERLEKNAGNTFAAADAVERLRTLRALGDDPEYRQWVEDSIANAKPNNSSRIPLSRIPADFPPAARAAGIDGFTVVEFSVAPNGETQDPLIVASTPPLLFDGAALRAVRQWQFMQDFEMEESPRQVIRILFRSDSGTPLEVPEVLIE